MFIRILYHVWLLKVKKNLIKLFYQQKKSEGTIHLVRHIELQGMGRDEDGSPSVIHNFSHIINSYGVQVIVNNHIKNQFTESKP